MNVLSEAAVRRCSTKEMLLKIHRKISVLESLLESGLNACNFIENRLLHRCFPVNIAKFLITAFLQNTSSGCFWFKNINIKAHVFFINISKFALIKTVLHGYSGILNSVIFQK